MVWALAAGAHAQTVPDVPTVGVATPSDGAASIAFTPGGDGGAAIDNFRASCSPGPITATNSASPIGVPGLTNGTSYSCTVAAHNSLGWSLESGSVSVTPRTVPDAPTIGSATAGNASASVSFTLNSNGGAPIDSVSVTCTSSDGGVSGGGSGTSSPLTATGLTNDKTYTCRAAASNEAGWSAFSAYSNSFVPKAPTAPSAPTIGTATGGDAQISVGFTASSSPGILAGGAAATITGYTATCGAQSNTGGSSPIVVSGLSNGTSYTCTVTAINDVPLTSVPSAASNSVTPLAGTAPSAPTGVAGTRGNGEISVAFTASASPGNFPGGAAASITGYTATCGSQSVAGAGSPIVVTGLTNGTSYTCTVTATNDVPLTSTASASSPPVTPATTPGIPTAATASAANASISVSFVSPSDNGDPITNYRAECNPGGYTNSNPSSPVTVTGLSNGTAYTCAVQAYNSLGWGSLSSPSNPATPSAPTAPTAPTIGTAAPGNGTISVGFTASSSPGTLAGGAPASIDYYTATCGSQTNTGSVSPILVSGLSNGTSYTCTVTATNTASPPQTSAPSASSNSVTPSPLPPAPTIGTAAAGGSSVIVAFVPNVGTGVAIDNFRATCSPGGFSATGAASPITVPGLSNGTAYSCTVAAHNTSGWGPESAPSNSIAPRVQVQRTFVSATSGDDSNAAVNCTSTLPCRLFGTAMQSTVSGGEVIALASGDYGTVSIVKSVILTASPGAAAALTATSGSAVGIVGAGSAKIVLRDLQLVGAGGVNGITMTGGAALSVERCLISGFAGTGVSVSTPASVRILDTIIRDQGGEGIYLTKGAKADIANTKVFGNAYSGVLVDGSIAGTTTRATLSDSVVVGVKNTIDWGVSAESYVATGTAQLEIVRSVIGNATKGLVAYSTGGGSATVTLSRSRVSGNTTGLEQLGAGAVLRSRGNNSVNGNSTNTSGTITPLSAM